MAKFSMWIKHQTKNLLYTPKLWWGYNIKILPQKKMTFLKLLVFIFFFKRNGACRCRWICQNPPNLVTIKAHTVNWHSFKYRYKKVWHLIPYSALCFERRHWTAPKMAQCYKVTLSWGPILRWSITNGSVCFTLSHHTMWYLVLMYPISVTQHTLKKMMANKSTDLWSKTSD